MNRLFENKPLVHCYFPIVQWGYDNRTAATRRKITLPISYTSFSVILASGIDNNDSANSGHHISAKQLNSFNYLYGIPVCYIAIGV